MKFIISFFLFFSILFNPYLVFADEIILAGGCFWCMEHDLESLDGVNFVKSGYSGGSILNPNYENHNGHQEVVLVDYNSEALELDELLRVYFRNIDPLDGEGQFCDRGNSYKPVIFAEGSSEQKSSALAILNASKELNVSPDQIKVDLKPKSKFWIAEKYHQDFAEKNELKYKFYRFTCGRDQRLDQVWGDNARTNKLWEE